VSQAVICSANSSFEFQPKGGGHSYASCSLGGENGIVVISIENFRDIEVDQSKSKFCRLDTRLILVSNLYCEDWSRSKTRQHRP
jgi:hypothetical protein